MQQKKNEASCCEGWYMILSLQDRDGAACRAALGSAIETLSAGSARCVPKDTSRSDMAYSSWNSLGPMRMRRQLTSVGLTLLSMTVLHGASSSFIR